MRRSIRHGVTSTKDQAAKFSISQGPVASIFGHTDRIVEMGRRYSLQLVIVLSLCSGSIRVFAGAAVGTAAEAGAVRSRLGIDASVEVPENWIPPIVPSSPTPQTAAEVLGQEHDLVPGDPVRIALYNPHGLPVDPAVTAEIKQLLQNHNPTAFVENSQHMLSTYVYELYDKLFPPGHRTAEQISVLGPPVSRKNWSPSAAQEQHRIQFPADWESPSGAANNFVFYFTDGKTHYSLQTSYHVFLFAEKAPVAELMVAPSLGEMQRMLTARYQSYPVSSQGVFQMPAALLEKKLSEEEWTRFRNAEKARKREFQALCPIAFKGIGRAQNF